MDSIKNAAIIEPLNNATERALTRINTLGPDDELLIRLDDHGKDFIYTAVRWETNREGQRVHSRHRTNRDLDKFVQWRLPESEWLGKRDFNKRRQWRVGATDITAIITLAAVPREHIVFESEEAELNPANMSKEQKS